MKEVLSNLDKRQQGQLKTPTEVGTAIYSQYARRLMFGGAVTPKSTTEPTPAGVSRLALTVQSYGHIFK
jgi:hypothetical protein